MKCTLISVLALGALLGCSRDRDTDAGATDQGENPADIDTTRRIRRAVMHDDTLSFTAKNAKIITRSGEVTLQGRVKTHAERDAVLRAAHRVAGADRVRSQLEVKH